jgi:ABC-type multidrug transport system fused ATPase/permease subunit
LLLLLARLVVEPTLAYIRLGIHHSDSGTVTLGRLTPSEIRTGNPGHIAYVPRAPGLVSGTIANNVALGVPDTAIDETRVWRTLEQAEPHNFVKTLPCGIHSDLGKQADSLSGGQKQRMGLAHALYPAPRLLVLDEATSSLDAETEASISSTITRLGDSTAAIVFAH